MASRTLPNLALQAFFDLGEDGWDDEMSLNLLKLSVLAQGTAASKVSATPGSPTNGDVHIFDDTHPTQANKIAIRDAGGWVYVTPVEGWLVYNRSANVFERFDGAVWAALDVYTTGQTDAAIAAAIAALVASAPSVLDTLDELAAALGDDANFATTVATAIGGKVAKTGDTMSGDLSVPAEVYGAGWNGSNEVPTKNDVYDKIEALIAGIPGSYTDEQARDAVMAMISATGLLTETENDGSDTDTLTVPASTTTEVLTGTGTTQAVTPDALAALWEQAADVASAGTTSLGEGGYFHITGTTTITDIDFATDKAGRSGKVMFTGVLTLTHNGATLILPTGANIVTAAGDTAEFVSEGSDVVRCVSYTRADGTALVQKPTESILIACSDESTAITAGTGKKTFRMPYAFTVTEVRASAVTAPTGSTILIDINESGVTILSTKLMIDATEKTSTTAATPYVISDPSLADDAEMTIDFDQVGSTIAGAGITVTLIGHRT